MNIFIIIIIYSFVIEDENGEKIGFYTDEQPTPCLSWYRETTKDFIFNLNVTGNLKEPMKYEILRPREYSLHGKFYMELISSHSFSIKKNIDENELSNFHFYDNHYDLHELSNPLGRPMNRYNETYFHCKRIFVLQMN